MSCIKEEVFKSKNQCVRFVISAAEAGEINDFVGSI